MKQYICDICGKKSPSNTFILPVWEEKSVKVYDVEMFKLSPAIVARPCNLCDDCQIKIADMIGGKNKTVN